MSEGKQPNDNDVSSVRIAVSERVASVDPRAHAAWRTWLAALAHDADAVTAAALAYESLEPEGRDAWLDALDADFPDVGVPKVALFAPLLGVELDEARRSRIAHNVQGAAKRSVRPRALLGAVEGDRVCIVLSPLYLDFVELLVCRYDQDEGVREARHRWLAHTTDLAEYVTEFGGGLSEVPLQVVVEELAHAVVADRRAGRDAPAALLRCIDLFAPDLPGLGLLDASSFDEANRATEEEESGGGGGDDE